jgi:hypothetical protein
MGRWTAATAYDLNMFSVTPTDKSTFIIICA